MVHLELVSVPRIDRFSLPMSQFTRLLGLAQRVIRSSTSTNILRRNLRESIRSIERIARATSGVSLAHVLLAAAELEHPVKSAGALQVLRLITVLHVDVADQLLAATLHELLSAARLREVSRVLHLLVHAAVVAARVR